MGITGEGKEVFKCDYSHLEMGFFWVRCKNCLRLREEQDLGAFPILNFQPILFVTAGTRRLQEVSPEPPLLWVTALSPLPSGLGTNFGTLGGLGVTSRAAKTPLNLDLGKNELGFKSLPEFCDFCEAGSCKGWMIPVESEYPVDLSSACY